MESLRELFKIGFGPSSSHTMGPQRAASKIKEQYPNASRFEVELYGSLALTGKGHLTDYIIKQTLGKQTIVRFKSDRLPYHPNGMKFYVYQDEKVLDTITAYSIGGGTVEYEGSKLQQTKQIYPHKNLKEIIQYIEDNGISFYDYVLNYEDEHFKAYLFEVLDSMFTCVQNGLHHEGVIPGRLQLKRVAKSMYQQAINTRRESDRERLLVSSYAYAVSEENACGNKIVTAPTCGASGILPAVLFYCYKQLEIPRKELIKALAVAGLFGNVIKHNATISGADGGCQAEVGSACAMAAAAYGWILELNNSLIEYAAEMGLEHNLGLTCDPVGGYVQIPCIERNGFGALRAIDAASYAKQLGYLRKNKVSFDSIVNVMKETGKDLNSAYKETSLGGLAKEFGLKDGDQKFICTHSFCESICSYCDFCKVYYDQEQSDLYLQRLNEELSQIEQHHLKTIYIGGGTPSALNDEQLEKLMSMLKPYSLEVEEYCMEVNPESMDYYKLKILKKVVLIV